MAKKIAPSHRPNANAKNSTFILAPLSPTTRSRRSAFCSTQSKNSEFFFNETLKEFWPVEVPQDLSEQQQKTWKLSVLSYWLRTCHSDSQRPFGLIGAKAEQ